jgi:hypothetical protein
LLPLLIFGLQGLTEYRHWFSLFVQVANFSMWHLYCKDKNQVNYIALALLWQVIARLIEACCLNGYKLEEGKTSGGV